MSPPSAGDIVNAMTIDVEEYFQVSAFDRVVARSAWGAMESRVEASTRLVLDLFDEFQVQATFFVLGWVAERHPGLVREIDGRGHEIASHGYGHRLAYEQTRRDFAGDVRQAKRILEDTIGRPVVGYRAPSYSITARSLWALDVLSEEGYEYDCSIFPIRHDRYGLPGAPRHPFLIRSSARSLTEIPPATVRIGGVTLPAAGGGYFRLLPYAWTRWSLSRINVRERRPAVFYLHPWELDPRQPRLAAGPIGRFRHYTNLGRTVPRLRRLLGDFRFAPIRHTLLAISLEDATPATVATSASLGRA